MASGSKSENRSQRENRERNRVYQARTAANEQRAHRRRRDNIIAGVVGGLIVAGAIGGQAVYYYAGPGLPVPTPTVEPTTPLAPLPVVPPTVPVTDPSAEPTETTE